MQDSKLKELEDEVSRFGTHQIKGIAYFLTLLGGAIDAVSYIGFDHTLPVAQTGNLLLLMVDITRLNVQGIAIKMYSAELHSGLGGQSLCLPLL